MPGVLDLVWDFRKATQGNLTPPPGQSAGIYRGDDYEHALEFWLDEDETEPFEFTGTFTAQIRTELLNEEDAVDPDPAPIAEFECDVSGAGMNIITISLPAETTLTLPRSGVWDLQENSGGKRTTILAGKVRVLDDVTR